MEVAKKAISRLHEQARPTTTDAIGPVVSRAPAADSLVLVLEKVDALTLCAHEDIDGMVGLRGAGWECPRPNLSRVGVLVDLWREHGADDQYECRLLGAVVDPVGAATAGRQGDQLALAKLPLNIQRAKSWMAGDDDQHLLVCMVDVEWKAGAARRQFVQRCPELIRARLTAQPCPPPREGGPILLLVPVRLKDVGHARSMHQVPADERRVHVRAVMCSMIRGW